jgi:hypothetical protein
VNLAADGLGAIPGLVRGVRRFVRSAHVNHQFLEKYVTKFIEITQLSFVFNHLGKRAAQNSNI